MARSPKTLQEKVQEDYPEFATDVAGLSVEALEKRLSDYAKHRDEVEQSRDNDEELESAKAVASELGAPYRDALKAINLKSKYIVALVKEKGGQ